MNKELKKGIKTVLLIDTLFNSVNSISNMMEEADREIEELFGKSNDYIKSIKKINKQNEE